MPAIEMLCPMIGINPCDLSNEENYLLEIFLFFSICDELSQVFEAECNKNISSINDDFNKDSIMINRNFIRLILQDLINSSDYTMLGIAMYTDTPEEIIYDIAIGINTNPSFEVSRKIIELHRTARVDLYKYVIKKINDCYFENKSSRID